MSDASTTQPLSTGAHEATGHSSGHGKHRGPVSVHNDEATPLGRHRRPSEQTEKRA